MANEDSQHVLPDRMSHNASPQLLQQMNSLDEDEGRNLQHVIESLTSSVLEQLEKLYQSESTPVDLERITAENIDLKAFPRDVLEALLEFNGLSTSRLPHVKEIVELNTRKDGKVNLNGIYFAVEEEGSERKNVASRCLTGDLIVPDFEEFRRDIMQNYEEVKKEPLNGAANASYIPVLANVNPDLFGIAVCTVDGQVFCYGDADVDFSIQSCVKPMMYAMACEENGVDFVRQYVGIEASGLSFNEVSLNIDNKPHNPMVNAGAIMNCALVRPDLNSSAKFRYVLDTIGAIAGGKKIGFSQPTYLCESETAYRNQALMYYMRSVDAFPPETSIHEVLDFYLQCCSLEIDVDTAAVIAATLANGGSCPMTRRRCLSLPAVKATLTLMYSCGMYDFSGEWAANVGLPAKSGVSGLIYLVVPGTMGIAVYSPPLDVRGNSYKAIALCKRVLEMEKYSFGIFEQIVSGEKKIKGHASRKTSVGTRESDARGQKLAKSPAVRHECKGIWKQFKLTFSEFLIEGENGKPPAIKVPISDLEKFLASRGLTKRAKKVKKVLSAIRAKNRPFEFRDLFQYGYEGENILMKAVTGSFVVSDWTGLVDDLISVYEKVKPMDDGELPDILSELKRISDGYFGVSICTVDGQIFSMGDSNVEVPIMSTIKPILHAIVRRDAGSQKIRQYVGIEPTSLDPRGFALDRQGRPFNPYMESGALGLCSLISPSADAGSRFVYIVDSLQQLSGGSKVGFSQTTYLCEKEQFLQLKAVSCYMKGMGCFPDGVHPEDIADILFQSYAIEITCDKLAVMASTFAKGGVNPVSNQRCFDAETVKDVISLMYTSAMNQGTGTWQFEIGVPARGGPSGLVFVVVPNVMGIAIYSPKINRFHVSSRGFEFCKLLMKKYNFNIFDQLVLGGESVKISNLKHEAQVEKEEKEGGSEVQQQILFSNLCFSSSRGEVEKVREYHSLIVDKSMADYDHRTALHIACCDGHLAVVRVLVEGGHLVDVKDRWGNTPVMDAARNGHAEIVQYLNELVERDDPTHRGGSRLYRSQSHSSRSDRHQSSPEKGSALENEGTSMRSTKSTAAEVLGVSQERETENINAAVAIKAPARADEEQRSRRESTSLPPPSASSHHSLVTEEKEEKEEKEEVEDERQTADHPSPSSQSNGVGRGRGRGRGRGGVQSKETPPKRVNRDRGAGRGKKAESVCSKAAKANGEKPKTDDSLSKKTRQNGTAAAADATPQNAKRAPRAGPTPEQVKELAKKLGAASFDDAEDDL